MRKKTTATTAPTAYSGGAIEGTKGALAPSGAPLPPRPAHIKPKREREVTLGTEPDKLSALAHQLAALTREKADAESTVTHCNKQMVEVRRAMHELFEARGLDLVRIPGVGTFSPSFRNRPNIADEQTFFAWLEKTGNDGIIKRTVHPSTLASFVKERLEGGDGVPDGINNFAEPYINFRRSNG